MIQREDSSRITTQATGAMSYRRNDIKYRRNEAFVDVIENVNLLMSSTGSPLAAQVDFRNGVAFRRQWHNHDEGLSLRNTRMSFRIKRFPAVRRRRCPCVGRVYSPPTLIDVVAVSIIRIKRPRRMQGVSR